MGEESERKGFLFSATLIPGVSMAVVDVAEEEAVGSWVSGLGVCVVDGMRWTRMRASRSW